MSVKDLNNKKINIENVYCNSFVTLNKDLKEISKMLKRKRSSKHQV